MTRKTQRLDAAIEEYMAHRRSLRRAAGTLKNDRMVLMRFMAVNGNIYCHNLEERHVDAHFQAASETRDAALSTDHSVLKTFLRRVGKLKIIQDREAPRQPEVEKDRVPVADFPRLLDACVHPRDRVAVAIGLEMFVRGNELGNLRISDCSLAKARLRVNVSKKRATYIDMMPISPALDGELRRWLTYYTEQQGELQPHWFLVPAKSKPISRTGAGSFAVRAVHPDDALKPEAKFGQPEKVIQEVLVSIGFPIRDPITGETKREGFHTLRRSGARALFDELWETGSPDPLGIVMAMLHHKSREETAHYIGAEETRLQRDRVIVKRRGYAMAENVLEFGRGRGEGVAL